MPTRGSIRVLPSGDMEWEIPDLDSPSFNDVFVYFSPNFDFGGEEWCLEIWPNSKTTTDSTGYTNVYLKRISSGAPILVRYSVALKAVDGQKDWERPETGFFESCDTRNLYRIFSITDYKRRKSDLLIAGCLTIVCTIEIFKSAKAFEDQRKKLEKTVKEKDDIKKELDASKADNEILLKAKLDLEADLKTIRENLGVANASGSPEISHHDKILQDFRQLYVNQENWDVTLKVKGREFQAHKAILTARSPVFASTFRNVMKEKETGIVDIEDCDPSVFPDFLCFLYSDDVDSLSDENVFGLFMVADKYDVTDLRRMCLKFIKENLSVEIFCETLTVALQHGESDLIRLATDFFIKNADEILVTVKWQLFAAENPTQSNELVIKLVESYKSSKS